VTTWIERSDRAAQASGIVSVQANRSIEQAPRLLQERAKETGYTVDEIARAVVDRLIRFD